MPDYNFGMGVIRPPTPEAVRQSMCTLMAQIGYEDDLLMRLFPAVYLPEAINVRVQFRGVACGVQNWRGVGQTPEVVNYRMVARECVYTPQRWGDMIKMDEQTLENLPMTRDNNCCVYDPSKEMGLRQTYLLRRQFNRQRLLASEILRFGTTYALEANTGAPMNTQTFPINKPNLSTPAWTDFDNSTPFLDIFNMKLTYEQFSLCSFGRDSRLLMHPITFSYLQRNKNPSNWKIFGEGFCCFQKTLCQINELLSGQDLPQIVLYSGYSLDCQGDESIIIPGPTNAVPKRFLIPPGQVVWVGKGELPDVSIKGLPYVDSCVDTMPSVGELYYTMNVNTCGGTSMAGPVSDMFWHCAQYPKFGEMIQAWNGMFAPTCPGCIISFPVK